MHRKFSNPLVVALAVTFWAASSGTLSWAQHGGHGGHGGHSGHGGGHGGHFGGGHVGHVGGHRGHLGGGHVGHVGGHHGGHFDFGHSPFHFGFHFYPWYASYGYPWYDGGYYPYYDYYQPVHNRTVYLVRQDTQASPPDQFVAASATTTAAGLDYQRRAEKAFRGGQYNQAARLANHALVEMPRDGKLYLFTAQTLLAVRDYRGAAAAIHQAASLLEPDDWGYVVQNYRQYYRGRAYVQQMDQLNEFIKENPDATYAYFLRGYQHGFLGHQESALRDLNKAVELESRDQLAAQLIERFGGTPPAVNTPNTGDPPTAEGDGHEGSNHGSDGQSEGSNDNHPEAPTLLTSGAPFSARLLSDPNIPLAVSDQPAGKSMPADMPTLDASVLADMSKLSLADRTAALAQRTCPVTSDTLGSDGTPIKVQVGGRDVFVCCEGCIADLQKDPGKYLTALDNRVDGRPEFAKTEEHADKQDHSSHTHDH